MSKTIYGIRTCAEALNVGREKIRWLIKRKEIKAEKIFSPSSGIYKFTPGEQERIRELTKKKR